MRLNRCHCCAVMRTFYWCFVRKVLYVGDSWKHPIFNICIFRKLPGIRYSKWSFILAKGEDCNNKIFIDLGNAYGFLTITVVLRLSIYFLRIIVLNATIKSKWLELRQNIIQQIMLHWIRILIDSLRWVPIFAQFCTFVKLFWQLPNNVSNWMVIISKWLVFRSFMCFPLVNICRLKPWSY